MTPHRAEDRWESEIETLRRDGLHRSLREVSEHRGPTVTLSDGQALINFASNDYLGLASHPALCEAAARAVHDCGTGSGSSRLVTGTLPAHRTLEEKIARFKGVDAALVFSSGYTAALGTIPALVGKNDFILLDKLAHACLVDASRLSGATLRVFPHNDTARLEALLVWCSTRRQPGSTLLIVTESVFSMDGDTSPLGDIVTLAEHYAAHVLLDEAHGTGTVGLGGRGLAESLSLSARVAVHMGTLSKALGCSGGYIAGSATLIELLVNKARSFIFSTAPPPAIAAAASAAIDVLDSPEGHARVAALHGIVRQAESYLGIPARAYPTPILPLILGTEDAAVEASRQAAAQAGLLLPAIRYPTVSRGKARLRISLRADHTPEQVECLGRFTSRLTAG